MSTAFQANFSQLNDRLDVQYQELAARVRPQFDVLSSMLSDKEAQTMAQEIAEAFPNIAGEALHPLLGGNGDVSRKAIQRAIRRYPMLSLAALVDARAKIEQEAERNLNEAKQMAERVPKLFPKLPGRTRS